MSWKKNTVPKAGSCVGVVLKPLVISHIPVCECICVCVRTYWQMCLWDILSFGRKWPAFIYTACLKSLALRAFDCTVRCRVMAQFFSRYRTKWNRHILHCLSAGSTGMFTANLTGLYGSHVLVFENQRPAVAISAWGWSKAFCCGSNVSIQTD